MAELVLSEAEVRERLFRRALAISAGAHLLLADGSVHFVSSFLDLQMLFNLSNRNDRNAVSLEPQ